MGIEVTPGKQKQQADHRNQNQQDPGTEIPGDTDAPDIVGRTGEEMPEVAHDNGPGHYDDRHDHRQDDGHDHRHDVVNDRD